MKRTLGILLILAIAFVGIAAAGSIISASLGSVEITSNSAYAQTLPIEFEDVTLDPGEVFMMEGTGSISNNLNNANTYAIITLSGDTSFASKIDGAFYYIDTNFDWQYLEGDLLNNEIRVDNLPANVDYRLGLSITNGYNIGTGSVEDIGVEITFYAIP